MTTVKTVTAADGRDLILTRVIDAPRESVYAAWTEPEILKRWFAPLPWTTVAANFDLRPGGASLIVMSDPDGNEFPNPGVYLDVVKDERLVFTDAFTSAWEASEKAFIVVTVTFEDQGGKTLYKARVQHWNTADRESHEQMGFHEGWTICAEQLAALLEKQ